MGHPKFTKKQWNHVVKMWNALTIPEAAEALGYTEHSLRQTICRLRKLGYKAEYKPCCDPAKPDARDGERLQRKADREARHALIVQAWNTLDTYAAAEKCNLSLTAIRNMVGRLRKRGVAVREQPRGENRKLYSQQKKAK